MLEVKLQKDGRVKIIGEATIHFAEDLYAQLSSLAETIDHTLMLDMRELTDIDTAGVQILTAFMRAFDYGVKAVPPLPEEVGNILRISGLNVLLSGGAEQ